jgi:hypothetical protein
MGSVGRAEIPAVALLSVSDAAWTDGKTTETNEQAVETNEVVVETNGVVVGKDGQLVVNCDLVS